MRIVVIKAIKCVYVHRIHHLLQLRLLVSIMGSSCGLFGANNVVTQSDLLDAALHGTETNNASKRNWSRVDAPTRSSVAKLERNWAILVSAISSGRRCHERRDPLDPMDVRLSGLIAVAGAAGPLVGLHRGAWFSQVLPGPTRASRRIGSCSVGRI